MLMNLSTMSTNLRQKKVEKLSGWGFFAWLVCFMGFFCCFCLLQFFWGCSNVYSGPRTRKVAVNAHGDDSFVF